MKYPFIVFSIVGIVGTIFTTLGMTVKKRVKRNYFISILHISVPETKGKTISENVEDTIQMEKDFKFISWRTWLVKNETKEGKAK